MRGRALGVVATCTAMLATGAPAAGAQVLHAENGRCEADATWQLTSDAAGNWSATMSYATPPTTGCKHVFAEVEDDLDPVVIQRDYGQTGSMRFNLVGASVAANYAFAGHAQRDVSPQGGPLTIANGMLNAVITLEYQGARYDHVHRGLGSCGIGCFTTRMTWTAVHTPALSPPQG
jgi:hypothetical protein